MLRTSQSKAESPMVQRILVLSKIGDLELVKLQERASTK